MTDREEQSAQGAGMSSRKNTPIDLPPQVSHRKGKQSDRRLTLILDEETDFEQPVTTEEFVEFCRTDPLRLFGWVHNRLTRLTVDCRNANEVADSKTEEANALRQSIETIEEVLKERNEELMGLNNRCRELETLLADQILKVRTSTPPGYTSEQGPQRSVKLPDPAKLSDGKSPTFESWIADMEDKLAANADHYDTPALRMAYVRSRTEGRAREHLLARSRPGIPNPYLDSSDIFSHLQTIYSDVTRIPVAKATFRSLYQRAQRFQEFLSDFIYWATEAEEPADKWKEELYHRISFNLQDKVMRERMDSTVSFEQLAEACSQVAICLEQRAATRPRNGRPVNSPNFSRAKPADSGTPSPQNLRDNGRLTDEERKALIIAGKCFYCKEPGHITAFCPRKRARSQAAAIKALEPPKEAKETAWNEHQGNEEP